MEIYYDNYSLIRGASRRLLGTPWPKDPDWINECPEIVRSNREQQKYESEVANPNGTIARGDGMVIPNRGFYSPKTEYLLGVVPNEIEKRLQVDGMLKVLDIGCGDGRFMQMVLGKINKQERRRVYLVGTTLFGFEIVEGIYNRIYKGVGIENPPVEFWNSFDVVIAQTSVYYWSLYPEIATLHMLRMLKENGIIWATAPRNLTKPSGLNFDTMAYLRGIRNIRLTEIPNDSFPHLFKLSKST